MDRRKGVEQPVAKNIAARQADDIHHRLQETSVAGAAERVRETV
jgi:hypothetical protein